MLLEQICPANELGAVLLQDIFPILSSSGPDEYG